MNTSVQALQLVYIKMGGALTDTYSTIASGEMVGNYTAIPDVVEAIAQISKPDGGGGSGDNDFVVNYRTETDAETGKPNIVCDKTAREIYEACKAGKNVKALIPEFNAPIPIVGAFQENDDLYAAVFGAVGWEVDTFFVGVMHIDNSGAIRIQRFQDTLVTDVTLDNRLEALAESLITNLIYFYNGNNIEVENEEAILSLLQGVGKGVLCTLEPTYVDGPHLVLNVQSVNSVYNSSDKTEVTHTIIFSNVLPTATGVKCVFITQSATTNSTTTELISHTETYEEKILTMQAP